MSDMPEWFGKPQILEDEVFQLELDISALESQLADLHVRRRQKQLLLKIVKSPYRRVQYLAALIMLQPKFVSVKDFCSTYAIPLSVISATLQKGLPIPEFAIEKLIYVPIPQPLRPLDLDNKETWEKLNTCQ